MDQQRTQWFSLYHSLQHYKYHTYLMCKDEVRHCCTHFCCAGCVQSVQSESMFLEDLCLLSTIIHIFKNCGETLICRAVSECLSVCGSALQIASLRVQAGDLGQEETVQKCLQNGAWVEGLFDRFGDLINQVQQACR